MKYLILILVAITATIFIRVQVNDIAKGMYLEGCSDSALKLKLLGRTQESEQITKFCAARKTALDQYMNAFE